MTTDFFAAVGEERSPGLAGRIEQLLSERPWLTSAEICKAIGKNVASLVRVMELDGRIQRARGLSARDGSLFALAAPQMASENEAVLNERVSAAIARRAKGREIAAPSVDWRPQETIGEDLYAE